MLGMEVNQDLASNTKPSTKARKKLSMPWWMMVPGLALLVLFMVWPIMVSLYTSFTNLNVFYLANWLSAPFVGVANYVAMLTTTNPVGAQFWLSLGNALIFTGAAIIISVPLGTVAALAVHRSFPGRPFFRVLFIVPYAIPAFVTGLLWHLMLLQGVGLVDHVLGLVNLSLKNTFWLIGPQSMVSLIAVNVWGSWPFMYLFAIGALQSVPEELYEAAKIDGAGSWDLFRRITIPMITRPLLIAVALSFIYHFNNFTTPFVLFGTTPPPSATTLPLNIYLFGFSDMQFGAATAMAIASMVVLIIPVVIYLRTFKVEDVS